MRIKLPVNESTSASRYSKFGSIVLVNFPIFIYSFYFLILMVILWQAREIGLLPMPQEGMDQLSMLQAAADLCRGKMPAENYMYSPIYTVFLAILVFISRGDLVIMRILQAAICALIPVMIYKLSVRIRLGRNAAIISSLTYCFYAPAALISLDFLRAGPLSLCFISSVFFLIKAYMTRNSHLYLLGGMLTGTCILGRENFIPVVVVSFACCAIPLIRKRLKTLHVMDYFIGIVAVVLPVTTYNYLVHGSFSIIPGALNNIMGVFYGKEVVAKGGHILLDKIFKNIPVQCQKFLSSYEIPNSLSVYAHKELIDFLNVLCLPFNLIIAFAMLSVCMMGKKRGLIFVALAVMAYVASISCFDMLYRYRIPCVPLLCCLAGAGISFVMMKNNKGVIRIISVIAVLLILFITYENPNKMRPASERIAVAIALVETGRLEKAESYLDKLSIDSIDTRVLRIRLIEAQRNQRLNEENKWKIRVK